MAEMCVRNEANRYLSEVLADLVEYVDEIVILDDASTDNTVEVCKSFKKTFVRVLPKPLWRTDESQIRRKLYDLTITRHPDWILAVDADEIWENRFKTEVRKMMEGPYNWYAFKWYHLWTRNSYFLITHSRKGCMFRFISGKSRAFFDMRRHCGRLPIWVYKDPKGKLTDIRVKHLGNVKEGNRRGNRPEWIE